MNMANYARGLLDELDGAIRKADAKLEAEIRAELEQIAPEAREHIDSLHGVVEDTKVKLADGTEVPNKLIADIRSIGERLDAALAPKPAASKAPAAK